MRDKNKPIHFYCLNELLIKFSFVSIVWVLKSLIEPQLPLLNKL